MAENSQLLSLVFDNKAAIQQSTAITWEEARELSASYVTSRYPKATLVAIYGSVAAGRQKPLSDIDILVIDDEANATFREQIVFNGRMLQLMIMSSSTALFKINNAMITASSFFPQIVIEAKQILGEGIIMSLLKDSSTYAMYQIQRSSFAKHSARLAVRIANSIVSLSKCEDDVQRCFFVEQLASRFREFLLVKAGIFGGITGSELSPASKLLGGNAVRFDELYLLAMQRGQTAQFCEFIWRIVRDHGFAGWETSGPILF